MVSTYLLLPEMRIAQMINLRRKEIEREKRMMSKEEAFPMAQFRPGGLSISRERGSKVVFSVGGCK